MVEKEKYCHELIDRVIASIENHGGAQYLSSIILTGSFGRDEPTFSKNQSGELQLKSDVEIALVVKCAPKKVEALINRVSSEFTEDLNLMPIDDKRVRKAFNFNYSLVSPKYKTIFTYDLFNGSKTVWGEDIIGKQRINLDDIDPYEAKRLVANRIGELTYLQAEANKEDEIFLRAQWKGKVMLAIMSAWLICEKHYASSYHKQFSYIMGHSNEVDGVIGEGFSENLSKVFCFLRENGEFYEVDNRLLRCYVQHIDIYLRKCGIKRPRVNSVSRYIKYALKYLKCKAPYGIRDFEDRILQHLISNYMNDDLSVVTASVVWHNVLY